MNLAFRKAAVKNDMTKLDGKITALAEEILKRPLSGEEELEIYRISDAVGMRDVQSFLYLLLVFKLHEDTMKRQFEQIVSLESRLNDKFDEMGALSARIDETLTGSIERVLGEGTARIGAGMGDEIAEKAEGVLTSFGEYHLVRGRTILAGFLSLTFALAYRLGKLDVLRAAPRGSTLEAFLLLPAGWSVFFCGATYTFLWAGDNWKTIKKNPLYKTLFGVQIFFLSLLALGLL
jgi:hypothetical protein